ncbi:calcineurin B homologous protein 2 isoform X3 [Astatotilapia calliptera]|uniref:calcineurin B homologous protein 2 isoform X2 n=1 Tax=Maylandia zebra TaxID=106582 RepID=UPI0006486E98|nr:calcineurin B homologous protein 2 isoform X2 [Maylandia zebra]XP_026047379.1 calcineurin B homologous protein 2-like isoform X3 [Astatotilapia calliptera]
MGSSSSSRNKIPNAQELMRQTGFSSAHLLRLHDRFESLDRDNRGYLSPDDFEALGGLAMNPIGGRIIEAFFSSGIPWTFPPLSGFWLISVQLTETETKKEHSKSSPAAGPGSSNVLRAMLGLQVTEEQLQSIAERAIQEADLDKDDAISFDEFKKSLEKMDIDTKMSVSFLK